ncbi:hypothetical protein H8K90_09550 [Winogradskyella echinorum]|uniref:DUF2158 domain-containing protein n=1 Tax=Winogradskyella echinorum TaxID=538189 RepID=A0ABR6Y1M4_9FLAO|nr:hypothetical protein [Winogradskyella echinorum]MBC3846623.1 hypothetical protein [Winogradskyella echinorum]MBC5750971.1 hypothetical protein [Winogradskyella echinorum]
MTRKFKSGDWVKLKGKALAPKMEVLKYITKKDSFFGLVDNNNYLECIWYKNGERISEVFHQNRLIKVTEPGGLYKI